MIESHLALVYSTRGSAAAWLNRSNGLTLCDTYTLEQREEQRKEMICNTCPRLIDDLTPKSAKTFHLTSLYFYLKEQHMQKVVSSACY